MALKVGDAAPDFRLASTSGSEFRLDTFRGKACILYFYPKDFTSVCTKEACSFRDQFAHLRDLDVPVFGISRDSVDTHLRFKEQFQLPFDLLADEDGAVAKLYKARMPVIGVTKRITYLLDTEQRIAAVHDELFGDDAHVREMLKVLGGRE